MWSRTAAGRTALAALLVAALALAAAPPAAAAQELSAADAAIYQNVLSGLKVWSKAVKAGKTMPDPPAPKQSGNTTAAAAASSAARPAAASASAASASAATASASTAAAAAAQGAAVAKALGTVLAVAALEAEVQGTLGDPKKFPYPDGSKRFALYRLPKSGGIKGTCIFVHGCKHDPMSWFYKSTKCPDCTGLPEEVAHTKQCLARGYAVLALMSLDREYKSRCFSSSTNSDHPSAKQLVDAWMKAQGLGGKPKYIFGVSSGASFALKFAGTIKLDGVVSEVNMPWAKAWGAVDASGKFKYKVPPTAFYEMEKDATTSKQIQAALKIFKANNVPADVVKVPTQNITADFFSKRSMYITAAQSRELMAALKKIKLIDANGWIQKDPRMNREWTTSLPKLLKWIVRDSPYYNLISDESQIWQELNMAWSWHEIVSDFVRPTLMWLEAKGKADLNALVQQYSLQGDIACLTEDQEGCRRRRRSRAMKL